MGVLSGEEALKVLARDWDIPLEQLKSAGIDDGYVRTSGEVAHYAFKTPQGWFYTNNVEGNIQEVVGRRRAYYAVAKGSTTKVVLLPNSDTPEVKLPIKQMKVI